MISAFCFVLKFIRSIDSTSFGDLNNNMMWLACDLMIIAARVNSQFWIFVKLVFRDDNLYKFEQKEKNCLAWRTSSPQKCIPYWNITNFTIYTPRCRCIWHVAQENTVLWTTVEAETEIGIWINNVIITNGHDTSIAKVDICIN